MESKIKEILAKMTLDEKILLCSGEDFWHTKGFEKYGIPSIMVSDGPHGLRKQNGESDMLGINDSVPATSFPTASINACSWDTELLRSMGEAIAEEAKANGVAVVLGPGANVKRNPLCGRNFEYFSEDPYLSGKLAAGFISGAQQTGVGTSLKHFACNNQEYKRFSSDSVIDERTMREIYLTSFEIAVKESHPETVMCSYNKINGVHSSDNKKLLTDILRKEWGFDGLVVTDWGAMSDRIKGFVAGCDLLMPGGSNYGAKKVKKAVKSGTLDEKYIDICAERVLKLVFEKAEAIKQSTGTFDETKHHALAREIAEGSFVLLKNDDKILPLKREQKIALIGYMAQKPRYQGAGSSHINPTKLSCLIDSFAHSVYAVGCDENGDTCDELLEEAANAAKESDVAVVVAGLTDNYESEGFDRENMKMPEGHIKMIEAVARANPNMVVVLCSGSSVETDWADSVKGILYVGLAGQAGAEAIDNVLYGKVNPSGKLAETWVKTYADCPSNAYYGEGFKDAQYRESIYVGYRYYDKAKVSVRYPFGYGLSYTRFEYSDLRVSADGCSVTVKNTGDCDGAEVVQVYVNNPQDGLFRPIKELKGFKKVYLKSGESVRVEFAFDSRTFAVWNNGWEVPSGEYAVEVGGLRSSLNVQGEEISVPDWQSDSWYETPCGFPGIDDWKNLIGYEYKQESPKKGKYTMDNSVLEMKDKSFIMRIMYKAVESIIAKGFGGKKDYSNSQFKMMISGSTDCSLSSMQINGQMKDGIMQGLLEMANGHFFKGIYRMITKN